MYIFTYLLTKNLIKQMFGYAMDVIFPECVIRLMMEVEKVGYEEVNIATRLVILFRIF